MKRFLILTAVVLIALSFSVCANAWTGTYGVRVAGDKDATINLASWFTTAPGATGMVANSGASCYPVLADAPDNWGLYISSNVPSVGIRSGTYANALPTTGYYEAFTSWATVTSAKTNAKFVVTGAGGSTSTVYVNQTTGPKTWSSLGTRLYNASDAANTKITLTNDNQTTSGSLYLHSIKYQSATPGEITNTGILDYDEVPTVGSTLTWDKGASNSFFDVWLGTTSGSLTKVGSALSDTTLAFNLDSQNLLAGTQYFWRVASGNVDVITAGTEYTFQTQAAVPEPGSMLALGTGLIGLFGIILRKRA